MTLHSTPAKLAAIFRAVGEALRQNRQAFNQADLVNGNHGDHMVQVFEIAARAAEEKRGAEIAEAMEYAARLLAAQVDNGSAQVYARGLEQMARQFQRYQVSLEDLLSYVHGALSKDREQASPEQPEGQSGRSGNVLKALMNGLAGWGQIEGGQAPQDSPLDMGALFEFGMAYVQAKQRNASRLEVLADAAASVSPLSKTPHRYASGKLAIQALLKAMQETASGLPA
jgi:hypothetical protein